MDLHDAHLWHHALDVIRVATVAVGCGWIAERMFGSDQHGWFVPVFSGVIGLYVGPPVAATFGWYWGPSIADHFVLPIFAGAAMACLFVKLFTVGLEAARR